jgi:sterol 24-C-methyltransferase
VPGVIDLMTRSVPNAEQEFNDYDAKQNSGDASEDRDQSMVNNYYNLATDFYEYGWGQSFHFAHTKADESHDDSILRHEHRICTSTSLISRRYCYCYYYCCCCCCC